MRRLWNQWRRYRRVSGAGGAELFVYGECLCGWAMMGTEGSRWPKCPECQRQVMPPPGGHPNPRLEAAVILLETAEALEEVRRIGANVMGPVSRPKLRHYRPLEIARWLKGYGFGVDGRDEPPRARRAL